MYLDVLHSVYHKKLSEDKAYDLIEKILQTPEDYVSMNYENTFDLSEVIGMDKYEYTAYGHGAGLNDIAIWRYEGWPKKCYVTNRTFDYKLFGWTVIHDAANTSRIVLINKN